MLRPDSSPILGVGDGRCTDLRSGLGRLPHLWVGLHRGTAARPPGGLREHLQVHPRHCGGPDAQPPVPPPPLPGPVRLPTSRSLVVGRLQCRSENRLGTYSGAYRNPYHETDYGECYEPEVIRNGFPEGSPGHPKVAVVFLGPSILVCPRYLHFLSPEKAYCGAPCFGTGARGVHGVHLPCVARRSCE
jgi:hypothetical protein